MDEPPESADVPALTLLRQRTVGLLMGSDLLISVASAMVATALGWQAYARTHDPLTLGLIGLAEFVPAILLALPAGHIADRYDRRLVATLGIGGFALVTVALAVDAYLGDTQAWPLYLLAGIGAVGHAFSSPAFNPLLAASVPAALLSRVIALNSVVWQSATIGGPLIAGLLQPLGNPVPYVVAGVAAVGAGACAIMLPHAVGVAHVAEAGEEPTLVDALDGVRLIFKSPALFAAISLDLAAVLFGGVTSLIPVVARDILHVGAVGNGILRAGPGIGAVLVGIYLAGRPIGRRVGATLFAAVAVYGVFTIIFGLSRGFVLSFTALAGLAAADMVSVFIRGTLGPLLTPPALRGRVGAVERVFIGASNELGAFESGVVAALIGPVATIVLGGAISIAVAGAWAWRFPALRRVDRFEDIEPVEL